MERDETQEPGRKIKRRVHYFISHPELSEPHTLVSVSVLQSCLHKRADGEEVSLSTDVLQVNPRFTPECSIVLEII